MTAAANLDRTVNALADGYNVLSFPDLYGDWCYRPPGDTT